LSLSYTVLCDISLLSGETGLAYMVYWKRNVSGKVTVLKFILFLLSLLGGFHDNFIAVVTKLRNITSF
jgi:hypothetical protein